MPNTSPIKRPCCICRKWFPPDPRQKKRQVTCSAKCRAERHRRKCAQWNLKNRVLSRSNYLSKKLEKIVKSPPINSQSAQSEPNSKVSTPGNRLNLHLPREILQDELGGKNLIIIDYLIEQILVRVRADISVIPKKNPAKKQVLSPPNVATTTIGFSRHMDPLNSCN